MMRARHFGRTYPRCVLRTTVLLAALFGIQSVIGYTAEAQELSWDDLGGYLNAGYTRFEWEPGFDLDSDERLPVFSYTTEGLELVTLRTGLSFRYVDVFRLMYERPLEQGDRQQRMLEAYESGTLTNVENFLFGISLSPVAQLLGVYDEFSLERWMYGVALSAEYQRMVSRFYGQARAEQDLHFIDGDNDWSEFDAGTSLGFASNVVTNEYTVDLLGGWLADFGHDIVVWNPFTAAMNLTEFIVISLMKAPQVRAGFFDVSYRRPTAFDHNLTASSDGKAVAMAAEYEASGVMVGFRRARRDIDGLNMDLSHRWSTEASIDAYYVPAASEIEYSATEVDLWYQLPLGRRAKVIAGIRSEDAEWSYTQETQHGDTEDSREIVFDMDRFNTVYVSFSVSF